MSVRRRDDLREVCLIRDPRELTRRGGGRGGAKIGTTGRGIGRPMRQGGRRAIRSAICATSRPCGPAATAAPSQRAPARLGYRMPTPPSWSRLAGDRAPPAAFAARSGTGHRLGRQEASASSSRARRGDLDIAHGLPFVTRQHARRQGARAGVGPGHGYVLASPRPNHPGGRGPPTELTTMSAAPSASAGEFGP